jgi:hypothetical protein
MNANTTERFSSTLESLRDIRCNIDSYDVSDSERVARDEVVGLCCDIASEFGEWVGRESVAELVSVKDRTPAKRDKMYLVQLSNCFVTAAHYSLEGQWIEAWGGEALSVTHWMSMPKKPLPSQ